MAFFEQWEPQQQVQVSLVHIVAAQGPLSVSATATGFQYRAEQNATQMPVSSIRCFGSELLASQLSQILALVAPQQALLRLYQPHPELTPALVLDFAVALPADQVAAIREVAANWPLELVCLNNFVRLTEPGLLVMDMDSTAIQIECIDEIAVLAGVGAEVAAVTARAMNGELDFAQSLRQRVATLANAPEHILQQVLNAVPLMPGLTALVSHLQQQQWQVAIASGGFTFFTEALKQRLDLTATFANVLEIVNGKLTGQVLGEIVDAERKAAVVAELSAQFGLASSQTVAIGDGANDLPMLKVAALGVAFHAKPKVQAAAKAAIRQGSLLQLLYLLESEQA
ncbi:phosphoserine phosphatase SerB [Rheinheimera riviphila]|nr:phosphoserine phosphatase SerB [Rheinheimera riviphila]